jgi:hypothetical protein
MHICHMFQAYMVIIKRLKILEMLLTYVIGLLIIIDPLVLVPSYTTYSSRYDIVNYTELNN